jgi:hypothetical protein
MRKKVIFSMMLIFIVIASLKTYPSNSETQYEGLRGNIESILIVEYNLVKTLNKNGIDVTYYANQLNHCLDLLDKAEQYNNVGDNKSAVSTLNLASSILNNVDNDAKNTLTTHYSKGYLVYISNSLVPIVSTIIVAIIATVFWLIYKEYYFKKLLKMKPEVNKHEIK